MKLILDKFEGMNSRIAPEKLPVVLFQLLVNWRISLREGWLKARDAAKGLITSGITSLQNMHEFVDKSDNRQLVILDGSTLKESVYSGGYGALGSITNDERTAGSTVNTFYPVSDFKVLRSGAGVNASTDRPFWYGYLAARKRFNDAVTLAAGKYLTNQYPASALNNLFTSGLINGQGVFGMVGHASRASSNDLGLTEAFYALYAAPVFDDGQRGFPQFVHSTRIGDAGSGNEGSMEIYLHIKKTTDEAKEKRLIAVDLFVANTGADIRGEQWETVPAYFLERVNLNDDSTYFYETSGTTDNATSKVTIADYAEWLTFDAIGMFLYNVDDDEYYRVTAETINGTDMEFTVTPAPTNSASKTVQFLSRWYEDTLSAVDYYIYRTFYDNYLKKLGSEMYDYLGIPVGDNGVEDLRYKLIAIAGKRSLIACMPDEGCNKGYYSVANSPDIFPVLNEVEFRKDPTAIIDTRDESFLVFYNDSADLLTVFGDLNYRRSDNYLNIGATNPKAVAKVYDDFIAVFDYTGPYLLGASGLRPLGVQLADWWNETLTTAQKANCVVAFNRLAQEIWFSFPDYTTAPYTTGIVFVYDLRAEQLGKQSPWYVMKTDQLIKSACRADDLHLLTGSATVIRDWNNDTPDEEFDSWLEMLLLQNPEFDHRVNMKFLKAQFEGNLQLDLYKNGGASPAITRTLADTKPALLHSVADTFKVKLTAADAEDGATLKTVILNLDTLGK